MGEKAIRLGELAMTSAIVTEPRGLYSEARLVAIGATKGRGRNRRMVVAVSAMALVAVLILASGITGIVPNSPSRHATTSDLASWMTATLDSAGNVGIKCSISTDSENKVHISYADFTNNDLKYVTNASGSWAYFTLDSTGDVGLHTSIAMDSDNKVHIGYWDFANEDLKYATNAEGSWAYYTLDSTGWVGREPSIAVDSSKKVHISYDDDTNNDLKYATNAGGSWAYYTLDSAGSVGIYSSIAVDSSNNVHISYHDGTNSDLKYATNAGGSWACYTLDSAGDVGDHTSIAVDSSKKVHISYYNDSTDDLKYATNAGGSWAYYTLDSAGSVGIYSSIAVDSSNNVHISYHDETNGDLKYATNAGGLWAFYTVDSTGDVGEGTSIAVDSNNYVHISYLDYTNYDLKYATDAGTPSPPSDTHDVLKGAQGPRASAVSWEYVPLDYGTWTGHIVNNGLRSLLVDVYDITTGVPEEIMHQRIRFAANDAYPYGEVNTSGVVMSLFHKYSITMTPNGPKGSSCTVEDMYLGTTPVAMFTLDKQHMNVFVDASSSYDPDGTIMSYDWTFGDGGVASGIMATHTYAAPGVYEILLVVRDNDGFSNSKILSVNIEDDPPTASFTYTKSGLTVNVDASGSSDDCGIVNYAWDWGDGTTGSGVTASHTYGSSMPHSAWTGYAISRNGPPPPHTIFGLIYAADGVTPVLGCDVTITNLNTLEQIVTTSDIDIGYYVIDMSEFQFAWAYGDVLNVTAVKGTAIGWAESPVTDNPWWYDQIDVTLHEVAPPQPIVVTITLTVTDTIGQTSNVSQNVSVSPPSPPIASFTVFPPLGDTTTIFTFDASSSSDAETPLSDLQVRWDWENDGTCDTGWSTEKVATHQFASPGTYTVCLEVMDTDGFIGVTSKDVVVSSGTGSWIIATLDSAGSVGVDSSIAIDSNNKIHISYYDASNRVLKYATNAGGSWAYYTLDNTGDVGGYSSIAIDSGNKVHISYLDGTNLDLKYATNVGGSWTCYTLDSTGEVGWATSIAVDSNNNVHISYCDYTNFDLKYATNAGGSWAYYTLDSMGVVGTYTSIAVDSNNEAHISYLDGTNFDLKYATNAGGSWACYTLDSNGLVGFHPSIAVDSNNAVHVSYYDETNGDLKYATNAGGTWSCYAIDSTGRVGWYTSIAVDSNNNVHISYCDLTWIDGIVNWDLKYATNIGGSWTCYTLDSTGEFWDTSIAVDSNNKVHISYYDFTNGNLKYATNAGGALPPDTPPIAAFTVSPPSGDLTMTFTFDASGSWDAETPLSDLRIRWDWEGDGAFDTGWSTDKIATHTYSVAGSYSPTVEVMDSGGLTSQASAIVSVSLETGYTPHGVIRIDGNGGFTQYNGVTRGSGTQIDPYVIEGWEIDASGYQSAIYVYGSNVFFEIANCYVHNAAGNGMALYYVSNSFIHDNICSNNSGSGIVLTLSDNNILSDNICSTNSWTGINLGYVCDNNTLSNNTCSNNRDGILLYSSSGNTLSNNTCSSNNYQGIYLESSSNNTICNNTCSSNGQCGMWFHCSSNNTICNNNCSPNNGFDGMQVDSSSDNTICNNNFSSNSNNGIWLHARSGGSSSDNTLSNNTCSYNRVGIRLELSSRSTIDNNSCISNNQDGVRISSSSDIILSNNMCSSNGWNGILLYSSDNNKIAWNLLCSNSEYGVYIESGSGNRIWSNTFCNNNGAKGIYDRMHVQAVDSGPGNWWNSSDGYGSFWSDWTTPDSDMDGIVDAPYLLDGSAGAKDYYPLTNPLTAYDCPPVAALSVSPSKGSTASLFTLDASASWDLEDPIGLLSVRWDWEGDGTFDTEWSTDKIATHTYSVAGYYFPMVEVMDSGGHTSQARGYVQVIPETGYTPHGVIEIYGNDYFTLENGVVRGSGTQDDPYVIEGWEIDASEYPYAIFIYGTSVFFEITNCSLHNADFDGIYLYAVSNGFVSNNICTSNGEYGIYLGDSRGNTICNNTCSNNVGMGITLYPSSGNSVLNNTCSGNEGGILIGYSSDNIISDNTCSNNVWEGIYLYSSSDNTLVNNNCSSNGGNGIYLYSSNDNAISWNRLYNNLLYGVSISSGSNNAIWNNSFIGNNGAGSTYDSSHIQAYDDGTNNWWNRTEGYGNFWSDWTGPDANADGIVDMPYSISGTAGAKDYYPMTTSP